jgi:hypothetical protein
MRLPMKKKQKTTITHAIIDGGTLTMDDHNR